MPMGTLKSFCYQIEVTKWWAFGGCSHEKERDAGQEEREKRVRQD